MILHTRLALAMLLAIEIRSLATCDAAVLVVSNRTKQEVRFSILQGQEPTVERVLQPGELVTLPFSGGAQLEFTSGGISQRVKLAANSAYAFSASQDAIRLEKLSVPAGRTNDRIATALADRGSSGGVDKPALAGIIPLKILVDEEEPGAQPLWEDRLRKRIALASDILERHCQLKLEVVAVGTWQSDNQAVNLVELLHDFERKVSPDPARLAIGFTSQRVAALGCSELSGGRGAIGTHILVKERFGRTERERLELLLHEMGHYLGAAHTAQFDSVMRQPLGDGRSAARDFRIGFDPLNTLVMNLFADEVRGHDVHAMQDFTASTRVRLRGVYADIAQTIPADPLAGEYAKRLDDGGRPAESTERHSTPRSEAARQVVAAIVEAADRNQKRPATASAGSEIRLTGDKLTDYYFRHAAAQAAKLPPEHAVPGYLLGLAIALDTSDLLRKSPWTRELWQMAESDAERAHRLNVLGLPTMQSRHDLTQHFVVSCALTVMVGSQGAETAGIIKELKDANGGSGFSFADLTADLAGIAFATRLQAEPAGLDRLAHSFLVADYLPTVSGLREGLSKQQFETDYGSVSDDRFFAERNSILQRIRSLRGARDDDPDEP